MNQMMIEVILYIEYEYSCYLFVNPYNPNNSMVNSDIIKFFSELSLINN